MSATPADNRENANQMVSNFVQALNRTTFHEPTDATDTNSSTTWITSFYRLNQVLSGSSVQLPLRIIDISLLVLGLYYGANACVPNNAFYIISIVLLAFNIIDIVIVLAFLPCYSSSTSEEQRLKRFRTASSLRSFFNFLTFITVCFGTYYVFQPIKQVNDNCEFFRFCLGIFCMRTWMLPSHKTPLPALPVRQAGFTRCAIVLGSLFINSPYFGTVLYAMSKTQDSKCIFNNLNDFYFGAPLKSFAFIGLILTALLLCHIAINSVLEYLFFRFTHWRTCILRCLAFMYIVFCLITFVSAYYSAIGAVFLFQPRSGGSCRLVAPSLYKTLYIWQWIRLLAPFIIAGVACFFFCIAACYGARLVDCVPASVSVPLLHALRVRDISILCSLLILFSY